MLRSAARGRGLVPEQQRRAERRRRRPPNSARTSRPRTRTAGTEPRLHCGCKASERVVCACVGRVAGWGGAPSWHRRYQAGDDEGHQAHDAEAATIERTLGNDKKVQLPAGAIPPSSAPVGVRSSGPKLSSMQSRRARNQRSQKQARCVLPTRAHTAAAPLRHRSSGSNTSDNGCPPSGLPALSCSGSSLRRLAVAHAQNWAKRNERTASFTSLEPRALFPL